MPQSLCVLDGFAFPYNPYPNINPAVKSTSYNPTVGGGYLVTWLDPTTQGTFVQDQQTKMSWPVMGLSFYTALSAKFQKPGTLVWTDPEGVSWTVKFINLTPKSLLKGGDDALEDVEVVLQMISQP